MSDNFRRVNPTAIRKTAEERREEILEAAFAEFAKGGLHGTSTDTIAHRAGVSQPYLFRLYGTKKDLFLATVKRGFAETRALFVEAAAKAEQDEDVLQAMAHAYRPMLRDRSRLLSQLHSYAACEDPEIREVVREEFAELWRTVARLSGREIHEVQHFFAIGMLLNVAAAMDLPALDAAWARDCLGALAEL